MFSVGDKIIYGSAGVCEVSDIAPIDKSNRKYYKLTPIYGSEVIFTPIDTKVFMRAVMTREEAEALIRQIPNIESGNEEDKNFLAMRERYQKSITSHECEDLIQLIKSIYEKGMKKKLGTVDERYMKRAEDIFYGELSVVLEIERDDVTEYIKNILGEV